MNLGNLTRGMALGLFAISALSANAQSVSMWWNKTGDAAVANPGSFVDVVQGTSSINISVYLTTSGLKNNIQNTNVMLGYDTTTTYGNSAVANGSGLTVSSLSSPVWNTAGLPTGALFGGSFGGAMAPGTNVRPWGLFETYAASFPNDFGFSNTTALKLYSVTINIANTLVAGDTRDISVVASDPIGLGSFDSNVSDTNSLVLSAPTYTAKLRIVSAVPEPASFAVLGLGAVALLRRRKK